MHIEVFEAEESYGFTPRKPQKSAQCYGFPS